MLQERKTALTHNILPGERFVTMDSRPLKSDLPFSFWSYIAKRSCDIHWKGIPMQKSPFQIATTQQLIQDLKPKTIIEFGTFKGGTASWFADIQNLSVPNGKVITFDIDMANVDPKLRNDPRIEFIQGDSNKIEEIFPIERMAKLLHPILLIEDAHINTVGILEYFHQYALQIGDYFIVEDTNIDYNNACYSVWIESLERNECQAKLINLNNKIRNLQAWLEDKKEAYLVDTKYVDPFGITNASKNWNSVLRKFK